MWFFEHFPLSSDVLYGVSPRAEDVSLLRDVEEFIGKKFADAAGEEDCTKSRPTKFSQVSNYMQWLKPRVGLQPGTVDPVLLSQLTIPPEDVEAAVFTMMKDGSEALSTDSKVRQKLKEFLTRRF